MTSKKTNKRTKLQQNAPSIVIPVKFGTATVQSL